MSSYANLSRRIVQEMEEVYSFNLDVEQIAPLVRNLRSVFKSAKGEIARFADTLTQIDSDSD